MKSELKLKGKIAGFTVREVKPINRPVTIMQVDINLEHVFPNSFAEKLFKTKLGYDPADKIPTEQLMGKEIEFILEVYNDRKTNIYTIKEVKPYE